MNVLRMFAASILAFAFACGSKPESTAPRLEVALQALSLLGANDAIWDIEVTQQDLAPVFRVRITSSSYGDSKGSATYVGPCVAGQNNIVNVWLRGVYTTEHPLTGAPGEFAQGTSTDTSTLGGSAPFVNPGRLTQSVPCVENEDTLVTFNVTIMRPAIQGFFDIAVDFNDIFCSTKLDTGLIDDEEACHANLLLHNPDRSGQRDMTYNLALACTAGPGADVTTALYLDDIVITCPTAVITIDPAAGVGNRRFGNTWLGVSIAPSTQNIANYLFQVAVYQGDELLVGQNKRYWAIAIGAAAPGRLDGCSLASKASADDFLDPVAIGKTAPRTIDTGDIYPFITYQIPNLGICAAYPFGSTPGAPGTNPGYTYPEDEPIDFDHRYPETGGDCDDGRKNGEESDVDCGGPCPSCAGGRICRTDDDCQSERCVGVICRDPACDDNLRNGNETDVDCGGDVCDPCDHGASCLDPADCESNLCPDWICRPETCIDLLHNQGESDVDCGGPCPPCDGGEGCVLDSDCANGECDEGTCSDASCTDGVRNGDETGTDCGGASCPPCPSFSVIDTGWNHTCAVSGDGSASCWGDGTQGALGHGTLDSHASPVRIPELDDVTTISAGTQHTCAVLGNGSAWCWGHSNNGRLGVGSLAGVPLKVLSPMRVAGPVTGFLENAVSVSAGLMTTCAVLADRTAWCWGYGLNGERGDGVGGVTYRPSQVRAPGTGATLNDVSTVSVSHLHACALLGDGAVWCWGSNDTAQLGAGHGPDRYVPVRVKGEGGAGTLDNAVSVAAGVQYSCAALANGSAWCWGRNHEGQLGDGTVTSRPAPVRVKGPGGSGDLTDVTSIQAGQGITCAVRSDRSLWCWGKNPTGHLGDGSFADSRTPVQVVDGAGVDPFSGAVVVSPGTGGHTCAVTEDQTAWCWGSDYAGKLGDGGPVLTGLAIDSPTPVQVVW